MKEKENLYDLLSAYMDVKEESINVLDEQIDTNLQLEYFECSRNSEKIISDAEIIQRKDLIFDHKVPTKEKKVILVQLASLNNVEAYRTIEKYLRDSDCKLHDWAYMALLENKLLLESQLLDENKILITSGLGAKGNKLRYFIVFFTNDGSPITNLQKKIITNELSFAFNQYDAEIESLIFENGYASFTAAVPISVPVQEFFNKIVYECNEFGSFLFDDYIITNVKVLSLEEIQELLALNNIL